MAITLTEAAAARVKSHLKSHLKSQAGALAGGLQGLRLSVKKSGCSGWAYILDYATDIAAAEQVFDSHGVAVVVGAEHLAFLDGTEIDYVEDGLSAAFHFNNPNVTEQCGCGESFTVN